TRLGLRISLTWWSRFGRCHGHQRQTAQHYPCHSFCGAQPFLLHHLRRLGWQLGAAATLNPETHSSRLAFPRRCRLPCACMDFFTVGLASASPSPTSPSANCSRSSTPVRGVCPFCPDPGPM